MVEPVLTEHLDLMTAFVPCSTQVLIVMLISVQTAMLTPIASVADVGAGWDMSELDTLVSKMTEVKDVEKYFAPSISIVYEVSASVCQDFIVSIGVIK